MITYDQMLENLRNNEAEWKKRGISPEKRDLVIEKLRRDEKRRKDYDDEMAEVKAKHDAKLAELKREEAGLRSKLDAENKKHDALRGKYNATASKARSMGAKVPDAPEEPEHLILAFDRTKKWVGADVSRNGTHAVEGAGRYKKQGNMLSTLFTETETLETKRLRIECMIKHLKEMGVTEAEASGKSEYVEIAKEFMKLHGIAVKGEPKESVLNVDKEPVARLA